MSNNYFITGTDTDAGKTLIAASLLCKANQSGLQTLGLKPLAAGAEITEAGFCNEDAVLLQKYSSILLDYEQVNPVLLQQPMAPHIAAAQEGKRLKVDTLEGYIRGALTARPQFCVIEGAGGWRVPLNPAQTMADLVKALGLPVILVVGMKLGCLNHALLTAEAIQRDGLSIAAWVATQVEPNMFVVEENLNALKHLLPFPHLGFVPWLTSPTPESVAAYLDLQLLGI
ncbi:dethiobiotin synthetase [Alteromonadaceae bacterium Bs31]|nr:dethiobiotin synthetase [Alteromonadaceae bacterium Bs31]